jgi:hypothetical protein
MISGVHGHLTILLPDYLSRITSCSMPASGNQGDRMAFKRRSIVWTSALVCALLAVAANAISVFMSGFDLSSVLVIVIVPVGLMALGAATASGFVLAAKRTQLAVNHVDLVFLMLLCSSMVFLVYGCEYLAFQHPDRLTFSKFVVLKVTRARYLMQARGVPDAPPMAMGDAGWALLLVKTGCMLAIARHGYSLVNAKDANWAV